MKFMSEFELADEVIPMDWRRCILSFLKLCLSEANGGKYLEDYYGPAKEKPFCFSVAFEKPVFLKDTIEVKGKKLRLMLSTADSKTGFILFSAVAAQKGKAFPLPQGNKMQMTKISQLQEQEVKSNRILVKTLEPLCVRKHNKETNRDHYYSTKQEDFENECRKVLKTQLMTAGFSEEISEVAIIPVNTKSIVVKYYGINIESSLGDFVLEGDKSVLNYLLKSGLGSRRSSGFGVVKVLAEE